MDELRGIRNEIDDIDEKLIKILNRRFCLSLAVGEIKRQMGSPVFASEREDEIRKRIKNESLSEFESSIMEVYEKIFEESKKLQKDGEETNG